jgi:hypothetical protein
VEFVPDLHNPNDAPGAIGDHFDGADVIGIDFSHGNLAVLAPTIRGHLRGSGQDFVPFHSLPLSDEHHAHFGNLPFSRESYTHGVFPIAIPATDNHPQGVLLGDGTG